MTSSLPLFTIKPGIYYSDSRMLSQPSACLGVWCGSNAHSPALTALLCSVSPPPDEELEPPFPEDSEDAGSRQRSGRNPPCFGSPKGPRWFGGGLSLAAFEHPGVRVVMEGVWRMGEVPRDE